MGSIVFETRDIHNYRVCIGMSTKINILKIWMRNKKGENKVCIMKLSITYNFNKKKIDSQKNTPIKKRNIITEYCLSY